MNDSLKLTGKLQIELRDRYGRIKDAREVDNLVVTVGKNLIANRLGEASPTMGPMTYMGLGTSTTAATVGDTVLGAEIAGSRTALSTPTVSGNQVTYSATFGAGVGTGTVSEAGLFNASTGGTMLAHSVFTGISKGSTDTMTVNWTVTIS